MYIRRVESNLIRSRSVESGFHTTVLEFEVSSSLEVSINDFSFLLYRKHGSIEKLWIDEKRWFCAFLPEIPAIRSVYFLSTWRTWSSARFDSLSVCITTFNVNTALKQSKFPLDELIIQAVLIVSEWKIFWFQAEAVYWEHYPVLAGKWLRHQCAHLVSQRTTKKLFRKRKNQVLCKFA